LIIPDIPDSKNLRFFPNPADFPDKKIIYNIREIWDYQGNNSSFLYQGYLRRLLSGIKLGYGD